MGATAVIFQLSVSLARGPWRVAGGSTVITHYFTDTCAVLGIPTLHMYICNEPMINTTNTKLA